MDPPHRIAVLNKKGGTGKTTIAVCLAEALSAHGRAIVLDLDDQQSATRWAQRAPAGITGGAFILRRDVHPVEITIEGRTAEQFGRLFRAVVEDIEGDAHPVFSILDCPPALTLPAQAAALSSDLVLIPIAASGLDFASSGDALQIARAAQEYRQGGRPAIALVPSLVQRNALFGRKLPGILEREGGEAPVFKPGISRTISLAEAPALGRTLKEHAPRNRAVREFDELAEFCLHLLRAVP